MFQTVRMPLVGSSIKNPSRSWPEHATALTVWGMPPRPALELLEIGPDLLAVASSLPPTPSLHLRLHTTEAIAQRFTAQHHASRPASAVLQVAVATLPTAAPPQLTSVSVLWLPASPRRDGDSLDLLRLAVSLWSPHVPASPFHSFRAAYAATLRLVSPGSGRPEQPST